MKINKDTNPLTNSTTSLNGGQHTSQSSIQIENCDLTSEVATKIETKQSIQEEYSNKKNKLFD